MTMYFGKRVFAPSRYAIAMLVATASLFSLQAVDAQPSQSPLISRDGGGVPPNIMLTMDDSGSMMFQHMPEDRLYLENYTVTVPGGIVSVRMDPADTFTLGGPGSAQGVASQFNGTIAARQSSANWRQKFLRSPDTNTIYYNPEVRYYPWVESTYPLPVATPSSPAGRMRNSVPAAAFLDPMNPTGLAVNLTNVRTVNMRWCFYTDTHTGCLGSTSSANASYDPGLYYRLQKDSSGKYKDPTLSSNYTRYSININASFPKVAARTDCAGAVGATGCSQTEERKNYANWFSYYRTRNLLARGAMGEAFAESTNTFRLGWGRINSSSRSIDGVNTSVVLQGVRDFTSTHKTSFYNFLYSLPAEGGTPLPGAMYAVGKYYSRTDTKGPWTDNPGSSNTEKTEKSCRRSYQIMVTDGYWNGSTTPVYNVDDTSGPDISGTGRSYKYVASKPFRDVYSNTLADYAMYFWNRDLHSGVANNVVPSADNPAFWQHMVNFTVGLGVRGTLQPDKLPGGAPNPNSDLPALTSGAKSWGSDKIDDLWHAALNSRGQFMSAKDPMELAAAVRESVGQALKRELREAGVATASTVLQEGNRKYVPMYRTGEWRGDVQAYVLDEKGQAGVQAWNAEARLPVHSARKIFTWDVALGKAVPFDISSEGTNFPDLQALSSTPASTKSDLINFIRGDRSKEGDGQPFRERTGVLGDFVNSNPVLVRDSVKLPYANLPTIGSSYATFLATKGSRTAVLFAGANDGMLHAFKDTLGLVDGGTADGKEVFAYIPSTVQANLHKLADKVYGSSSLYHQYYVDGPLVESDVYVNGPGASSPSWRNYLMGSLGAGGRAVFALDVTDTANLGANTVRWEINSTTYSDLGYVTAPIQTGVLPNGEWIAVFGNGAYSTAQDAVLFVVNLQTRDVKTLRVDSGSGPNGMGGVALVRNSEGQVINLYAGDLRGNVWKFNYSAGESSRFAVDGGAGTPLFVAKDVDGKAQPITQAPGVFNHSADGKLLVIGTGVLNTEAQANSTDVQSVYGVWDKPSDSTVKPLTRSLLVERKLTSFVGGNGATYFTLEGTALSWTGSTRGWWIDLKSSQGMRVVYPLQMIASDMILVSAVSPARNVVVCDSATGSGLNLLISPENGTNPDFKALDTNGDGVVDDSDASTAGYATNADGVDVVLVSSRETCTTTACERLITIQNTTSQQVARHVRKLPPPPPECLPGQPCFCVLHPGDASCTPPPPSMGARGVKDKLWRRILVPPIQ